MIHNLQFVCTFDKDISLNSIQRRPSRSPSSSRETLTGLQSKRLWSMPPSDNRAQSMSLLPYKNSSVSSLPSPTSFLSNRIHSYLRGSSVIPSRDVRVPAVSYSSLLSDSSRYSNPYSSSYRANNYLSNLPPISPPRSSYSLYRNSYSPSKYDYRRYNSLDDDDYEDDYSYRRRYRTPALTYRRSVYDEDDDDGYDYSYRSSRPSGGSYLKLSSYDGPYDGSYEADMAEMYDYVPFGPSRQGILELTADDSSPSYGRARISQCSNRGSPIPDSQKRISTISKVDNHDSLLATSAVDSLVSNTAAKARSVIADSKLPYKNATLVMSVEGSGKDEDGNRYGFKYYPPPIPLHGGPVGLDERILGINPVHSNPADSFLGNYLNRLRDMHTSERDQIESTKRGSRASSVVSVRSNAPSYSHKMIDMPVNIAGQSKNVPVSSYRSRLDDGQSHRVDVYPLVETETSVPEDRKVQLPMYNEKGKAAANLSLIDKINIKVNVLKRSLLSLLYLGLNV